MPLPLRLDELYYNLGHVLHQQGDLMGAAQSYCRALELRPDSINAHHNLAVILDEQGRNAEAIAHYSQAIALKPDNIRAYNNLGCTLAKQGRFDEAIHAYRQAIALQPHWAALYNNLGQVLAKRSPPEAIAAYRRAITIQPNLALAHYNLGKILQSQGQHAAAIDCFQRVLQIQPNHPHAYSDCGVSCLAQGQLDKALDFFRQANGQQPWFVDTYCQWSSHLTASDELTKARITCSQFLQLLQSDESSPDLHRHLAQTYIHLGNVLTIYGGDGQYQQAEHYYQQALQIQPRNLTVYLKLGDCLTLQGRLDAAILTYHLALTLHPNHPQTYVQLGHVLERQKKFDAAIACYQKVLEAGARPTLIADPRIKKAERRIRKAEQIIRLSQLSPSRVIDSPQNYYNSVHDWLEARGASHHFIALTASAASSGSSGATSAPCPFKPIDPLQSATSCQGVNCTPCLEKITAQFRPLHLGSGAYTLPLDPAQQKAIATDSPPRFVATVPRGRAWVAPYRNAWMACNAIAILTPDNELLADISRSYPGEIPGCQHPDPRNHRIFTLDEFPPLKSIDGTVAVLAGLSGHNYFHWMIDILPRFELLAQAGIETSQIDWFLINHNEQPFQQETLRLLGIPAEKILSSDRHPHIQATALVVPSYPGYIGWAEPWALDFLRRSFLPSHPVPSQTYPDYIYISRAKAHHRRVLNEADVLDLLQPAGFVAVELETIPFADQVALFANAKVIIAPHGGGLTNIIFCQPGTTVIELMTPAYVRHYYWVISQRLGLTLYHTLGEEFACHPLRQLMYPSPLTEDIWVNLTALGALVQKLGLN